MNFKQAFDLFEFQKKDNEQINYDHGSDCEIIEYLLRNLLKWCEIFWLLIRFKEPSSKTHLNLSEFEMEILRKGYFEINFE